jgi:hypothetical protein
MDDVIAFNFNMDENDLDKTSFTVDLNIIMENMNNILNTYKDKLMIIDEKFNKNNGSHYIVMFQNGRKISFDNFSLLEINNIRNILYDINIYSEEIRLDDISQEKKMVYVPKKELQQAEPLRVFLVDLVDKNTNKEELHDRMRELENLVETYGGIVVLQKYQKKDIPDPKTYV